MDPRLWIFARLKLPAMEALPDLTGLNKAFEQLRGEHAVLFSYIMLSVLIAAALLAVLIVYRCARSLMRGRIEPETWANLDLEDGEQMPVRHWENVIGRSRSADLTIGFRTVSRSHAALIRGEDGGWTLTDLGSKSGTFLNGAAVAKKTPIVSGDTISVGGVDAVFSLVSPDKQSAQASARTKPGRLIKPSATILLLTLYQLLIGTQLIASVGLIWSVLISYGSLIVLEWLYFLIFRALRRTGFEPEILCFFLTTIGFSVTASAAPESAIKQLAALILGLLLFIGLSWYLRDLGRANSLRWPMAAAAIGLLGINFLFGFSAFGAKNWMSVAGFSFQPSEFVKVAFVYAGGATLDRLFARRNIYMFIAFTGVCVGALALMGDFGTAAIFFAAFLVIVYMRSGDIATIALVCAVVVLGGFVVLTMKPYIAHRFEAWGHVWEYAHSSGFQQTRTMSAAASGGVFGLGAGNGWLKYIAAADTDLVFGILCEELGLLTALSAVAAIASLALFSVKSASAGRSSFYVICACTASSMLVFQTMLNVFGSVDIFPLTGVTFPFVSNGGSSLAACWCMLAFIKAADIRQNASFAVKLPSARQRSRSMAENGQDKEGPQ